MIVVVDATALVAIVTRDTGIDVHLADATRVIAPDLAVAEVLNVRWKYRRAGLPAPSLEHVLALFDRISLVPSRPYASDCDALSIELDQPAYDCLYAAVALREGGRFITADRKFARKLMGAKIDVVVFDSAHTE